MTNTKLPLDRNAAVKFHLSRVRLNAGGYDSTGQYWGTGAPLFYAVATDEFPVEYGSNTEPFFYLRANNREDAKGQILARLKNARFFR